LDKMSSVLPQHLVKQREDYIAIEDNRNKTNISEYGSATTNSERSAAVKEEPAQTAEIMLPETITDMGFMQQFTKNDQSKIDKYVNMFVQNAPGLIEKINMNWANKDYPNLKVAAHSLKPQLSYMGIKEEVSHIYELEQAAAYPDNNEQRINFLVENINLVVTQSIQELDKKE